MIDLNQKRVVTRFAPSPTGRLHIGGARTALFNWLFARANLGTFLLRIDDTDFERSNTAYIDNIFNSLTWLGIDWDNPEPIYQSHRTKLYQSVVKKLLETGHAYKCYASTEEIEQLKEVQEPNQKKILLRNFPESETYTVRFYMPLEGEFSMVDEIAGELQVKYENLDDVTLLRSDGNPTYMIASVVDDAEHEITHLIRGQEHLYNTYRQLPILKALGYRTPVYAHIPLIHDQAGHKLSKRNDAVSVYDYQVMGILPEALNNYMLRLGWGYGDVDIIDMEEAKKVFSLRGLGKSPARFDQNKLNSLNSYYIKRMTNDKLLTRLELPPEILDKVEKCLDNIKEKADSLQYINEMAYRIFALPIPHLFDPLPELSNEESKAMHALTMETLNFESPETLKESLETFIVQHELNKKHIFMFLRVCLTGMKVSPGLFEIMYALGPNLCTSRIEYFLG